MPNDALEQLARRDIPTLWGQSGDLPGYLGGIGSAFDADLRLEKDGTLAGYVESEALLRLVEREKIVWAPARDDAKRLQWIGYSANLDRFFGESGVNYEIRLAGKWRTWETAGTEFSIRDSLLSFGFDGPHVFEEWEGGLAAPEAEYSYKFVLLTGGLGVDPIGWIPSQLGVNWTLGVDPLGITSSIDPSLVPYQVQAVIDQLRKWKLIHSVPLGIVHVFNGAPLLGITWTLGASAIGLLPNQAVINIPIHTYNQLGVGALGVNLHLSAWTYVT